MNIPAIHVAIKAWLAWVTGVAADNVIKKDSPRGWQAEQWIEYKLMPATRWGRDQIDWAYDNTAPAGAEMTPHQKGLRQVQIQVQVWSDNDIDDGLDSVSLVERIRDRLILPDSTTAFAVAELGFADVVGSREIPTKEDDRVMSVAAIDLLFNSLADTAGTTNGYVDTWEVTGEAEDVDGAIYPIMTNEVLP